MRSRPFRTMQHRSLFAPSEPLRDKNSHSVGQEHPHPNPNQKRQASLRFRRIRSLSSSSNSLGEGASLTNHSFTVPIYNQQATPYTMVTDDNPFLSKSEAYNKVKMEERQQDNDDDDVSSISNDSARRVNINYTPLPLGPPAMIVVRNKLPASRSGAPPMIHYLNACNSNSPGANIAIAHQRKQFPVASGKAASAWPPRVVTSISASSSMEATLPIAPRHSASSTAFTHIFSSSLPGMSHGSPLRSHCDNVCSLSVEHGLQLDMVSSLSPDQSRVNTDNTAPLTPISVDQSDNNATSAFNKHFSKQIRKPKVITQRRATTGALGMIPSASLPIITGSRSHHGRRQHEHENDTGSVQPGQRFSCTEHRRLLGDRRRRKEIRGVQSVFSFGSLVGQSCTTLTPTTIATDTRPQRLPIVPPSQEFSQMIKANLKLEKVCGAETFASPRLRRDTELLWQRCVTQPVRRLTGIDNDSAVQLHRSRNGCLA